MPEVPVADLAGGLDARHAMAVVGVVPDQPGCHRRGEAGPSRMAVVFASRVEQQRPATRAGVAAGFEQAAHRRAVRRLGALAAQHPERLRIERGTPGGLVARVAPRRRRIALARPVQHVAPGGLGRRGVARVHRSAPLWASRRDGARRTSIQAPCVRRAGNPTGAKTKTPARGRRFDGGAPGRIRTSDPQVRSLVLYPTELRAQKRNYAFRPHPASTCVARIS